MVSEPSIPTLCLRSYRRIAPRTAVRVRGEKGEMGVRGSVNNQCTFLPTPLPPAFTGMLSWPPLIFGSALLPSSGSLHFPKCLEQKRISCTENPAKPEPNQEARLKTMHKYHQHPNRKPHCHFCPFVLWDLLERDHPDRCSEEYKVEGCVTTKVRVKSHLQLAFISLGNKR